MAKKGNRKSAKEALLKRIQKEKERRSGSGKSFWKQDLEGLKFWNLEDGQHEVDIIPFVAGSQHPDVDEGEETYVVEVFTHRNIGPEERTFICMKKTYGQPCAVCDYIKQLRKSGASDEDIKELETAKNPTSCYNVVPYTGKQAYDEDDIEKTGVRIWTVSHFFMEQYLLKLAQGQVISSTRGRKKSKKTDTFIDFTSTDQDEGKTICFTVENSGNKDVFTKFSLHRFDDRDYDIEDDILEQAFCLDDLLYLPEYDEVEAALNGESSTKEESEDEVKSTRKKKMTKTNTKKKEKREVEEEDDLDDTDPEDDLDDDTEPEDDDTEPEDDDTDPEDDDPEVECPDFGNYTNDEDCDECPLFEECVLATEEKKKEKKKKAGKKTMKRKRR